MAKAKYELDVSDVVRAAQEYAKNILNMDVATKDLVVTQQRYASQGKSYVATVEVQIDALRRLEIQVKKSAAATAEARGRASSISGGQAGIATLAPQLTAARSVTEASIRALYPAPSNGTLAQMAKYQNAISKIGELVERGKISGPRIQQLLDGLKSGTGLTNLTGIERGILTSLSTIGKSFNTAEKDAAAFGLTMRNAFRIAEAFILKDIIGAIAGKLKEAAVQAATFQIKISEIRTISQGNQASFTGWADSIRRVSDEFGLGNLDVAEAAYQAISNQVTSGQVETEKFLKSTANFARVGVATLTDATELTSSAINAYRLTLNQTDEVQAKFFKAVELGRFRVSDLANSFGRVAAPAATIGVSLTEVLAGLTTLTRQGVSAADAQTQLLNLFNSLAKPTEKLSELLQKLGVDSAQAGIATFGFTGFLTELEKATKGDVAAISELGGDLRAIRAIIGLTTRGFTEQFKSDAKDIENAGDSYRKAIDLRAEPGGDELIKEFNKIKNFFVVDLGQIGVNALAKINKDFVSLTSVAKIFGDGLIAVVAIIAAYKIQAGLAALSTQFMASSMVLATQASIKKTASLGFMNRALLATRAAMTSIPWGSFILQATAAAAIITEAFGRATKETESFEATMKGLRDTRAPEKNITKDAADKFTEEATAQQGKVDKNIDVALRDKLKGLADLQIKNNQALEGLKIKGKDVAESLKISFQTVGDAITKSIDGARQNVDRARRGIEQLTRSIKSTSETTEEILRGIKDQFATDDQKFQLRDNEIARLTQKISTTAKEAGPDAEKEIEALKKEVATLVREQVLARQQRGVDREKALRQRDLAAGRITEGQANAPIFVDAEQSRGEIEDRFRVIDRIQQQLADKRALEIKDGNVLIQQLTEQQRLQKAKAEILSKTTPLNEENNLRKEFKNDKGAFDATKFDAARAKAEAEFIATLKPAAGANKEARDIFNDAVVAFRKAFEQERTLLIAQGTALAEKERLTSQQTALRTAQADLKTANGDATKNRIQARTDAQASIGQINNVLRAFEKSLDLVQSDDKLSTFGEGKAKTVFGTELEDRAGRLLAGLIVKFSPVVTDRQKASKDFAPEITEARGLIALTRQLAKNAIDEKGNLNFKGQDRESFDTANKRLNELIQKIATPFVGPNGNARDFAPGKSGVPLGDLQQKLDLEAQKLAEAANRDVSALGQLQSVNAQLIAQSGKSQIQIDYLDAINRGISALNGGINAFLLQAGAGAAISPDKKHFGGLINGPWGNDNIPIMAESGEFVMSRVATKKFYPQLVAMNSGAAPHVKGHFSEGGIVNNATVGDINITMTGSTPTKTQVRAMGKAIKREIRQGNLVFPTKD